MNVWLEDKMKNVFFRCVEDCNEPIMITDEKGVLLYINPAWSSAYGYSKEEALGQTPRLLRSNFQTDRFYQDMWKNILDPNIGYWRGEVVNKTKDGRHVTVLLTITPYREFEDTNAPVKGYMGIAVDLTAKKELELKVLQQDRLASIGQIASGIAHEVGTPLGVIRGRAEFLAMQVEEDSAVKKGLDVIVEQIDRISKLIRSFLNASRAPGDIIQMPVELPNVVNEVLALTSQATKKADIEIVTDLPNSLLVKASTSHLVQVLLNLIVNAVHSIEKQKLLHSNQKYSIQIMAQADGNYAVLQIKDNGSGISAANMAKLFQPFFTTKDVGQGTGLGLAISQQLLASMGGTIYAESRGEGLGAEFILKLPLAKNQLIA